MLHNNPDSLDPKKFIIIKNARVHNLKNLSVAIPRNNFVVITGLSGSGKSSLAFDTLYTEGQRRYVESLSSYARQFIGRMNKPDVDYIKGISPAVAIEQKVNSRNPRSTVGTSTEIYDYLKLLFARIGKTFSPVSGNLVKRHTVSDVADYINTFEDGTKIHLFAPLSEKGWGTEDEGRENEKELKIKKLKVKSNKVHQSPITNHQSPVYFEDELNVLLQKGFSRILYDGEIRKIEDVLNQKSKIKNQKSKILVLIDRFVVNHQDEDNQSRIADSVQTAFFEGEGKCVIEIMENGKWKMEDGKSNNIKPRENRDFVNTQHQTSNLKHFSNCFELDGIVFEEPSTHLFSFNNPYGACKRCEGFGHTIGIDEDLVVPNKNLSIYEETIACWRGEKMKEWNDALIKNAYQFDFPIHRPYYDLTKKEKELLWTGNKYFSGLNDFFKFIEAESYKIQYRVMLSRYRGRTVCPECKGTRLRKDAGYVKVAGKSIIDLVQMSVKEVLNFFEGIRDKGLGISEDAVLQSPILNSQSSIPNSQSLSLHEKEIAKRLLTEITHRLQYLNDVGLGYLTLNRLSNTLSGGESQRINLATSLGSSLVGSMYILDEPSIGLHPRDTQRLIKVLQSLKNLGNTVIVVEHDEEIMRAADQLIDIGPMAGTLGGELMFQGNCNDILQSENSLTAHYLTGKEKIEVPESYRKWHNYIEVQGARENNLKNISVKFPMEVMTVVTGVSGSGKTSLVKNILCPALQKMLGGHAAHSGKFDKIIGDISRIKAVELVDQNPIGKSSRSNPVTYTKVYDEIRTLFAEQHLAKARNFKPSHFSFNVDGGRCEMCEGEGEVIVEMQFMADIHLTCESCNGKRFKQEVLEVQYKEKNIADVLDMTVDEAISFFGDDGRRTRDEGNNATTSHGWTGDEGKETGEGRKITKGLKPLADVGLGYIHLGQSSSTLSGGEAQRIKLATFLGKGIHHEPTLFIFDEPTTGLHFHDIKKLLYAFNSLIEQGHSIIIIEHNKEIIKCADWVIDLGTEGGEEGGNIVFEGTPEDLIKCEKSYTGRFLKENFEGHPLMVQKINYTAKTP